MTFARDIANFIPSAEVVPEESFDLVDAFLHAFDTAAKAFETVTDEVEAFVQHACA